ncbi:septum formation initiator family protein [Solihabitans fulvus]|uniref:Septum formation initiator family protein n=1 Tax=Solihabitans fulvus TaxID=1892852 RepID=A0A5B2WX60_9PSEU|nr:septum formation initiator family protein [Solihabitans fulvus]KAA2255658.1 septum formation initiator family protein [Solihabitans fulvus]
MPPREHDRERRRRRTDGSSARRPERARRAPKPERAATPAATGTRLRARQRGNQGTGGAFGMSSTRRAALLALVVCALALSIAVPLRTYLAQRAEMRDVNHQQEQLRADVQRLQDRQQQLGDPAQLEAEARRRLGYVRPGETPYIVHLPGDAAAQQQQQKPATKPAEQKAWYEKLWDSIAGNGS